MRRHVSVAVCTALLLGAICLAGEPANLVSNGDFEAPARGDGSLPDWTSAGDPASVTQRLSLAEGREGGRCCKLECTAFGKGGPSAHAMICQVGKVEVRKGRWYILSFWCRQQGILRSAISISIRDTSTWESCGLSSQVQVTEQWARRELAFQAAADCSRDSRLQFWFCETGTLWLDDVVLAESRQPMPRPLKMAPSGTGRNLLYNSSFECGADGWGTEGSVDSPGTGWQVQINRLYGEIDRENPFHAERTMRIDAIRDRLDVGIFDYFEARRLPIRFPLLASQDWIRLEKGREYTFSAYARSDVEGMNAHLVIQPYRGRRIAESFKPTRQWLRFQVSAKVDSDWCFVGVGPDLSDPSDPEGRLWVDALQLEAGNKASEYRPGFSVEFGIEKDRIGNLFYDDEPRRFRVACCFHHDRPDQRARLNVTTTDFFDQQVESREIVLKPRRGERAAEALLERFNHGKRGFFRIRATMETDGVVVERSLRAAVVGRKPSLSTDSRFGVNHAYAWPHLLSLCKPIGLTWFRDWSIKWTHVEPEQGRFDFRGPDAVIERCNGMGVDVLGLLPFPSAEWSSTAPVGAKPGGRRPAGRQRIAYAPRDDAEFREYVARAVRRYRGKIRWWQIFNEPLYTSYSLPSKAGYTGKDYAKYVRIAAETVRREAPDDKVLAGIGGWPLWLSREYDEMFAAGALDVVDAVDVHYYPGIVMPDFADVAMKSLRALMKKHRTVKPIWITEYGYYADDDPEEEPSSHFCPLLVSEARQAIYAARFAIVAFANGVDKIFYHSGTCPGLHRSKVEGMFFEYGGEPRKIYAAQATLSELFGPETRFAGRLDVTPGVQIYGFDSPGRAIVAAWCFDTSKKPELIVASDQARMLDLMCNEVGNGRLRLSSCPVFIVAEGIKAGELLKAIKLDLLQ